MKVVIDTNVVISRFLSPNGVPARIFDLLDQEVFELIISEPILAEYKAALGYNRIQARHGMNTQEIEEVINGLKKSATMVEVTQTLEVITADPDDNKFLACAVAGQAEFIVSGDKHLLTLKDYQTIQIVTPSVFFSIVSNTNLTS